MKTTDAERDFLRYLEKKGISLVEVMYSITYTRNTDNDQDWHTWLDKYESRKNKND